MRSCLLKFLIVSVILSISLLLIILNITHPEISGRHIFTGFVFFVLFERLWEAFFTTKEHNVYKLQGDWTLPLITICYAIMGLVAILEFFLLHRKVNAVVTLIGIFGFLTAFLLRWWGILALGEQWAIHAIGAAKLKKRELKLVKQGPYKYIRHPIYLSIIIEVIALALIPNSYYALYFAVLVCVPLLILRTHLEEKSSVRKFGEEYIKYKEELPMFIPFLKSQV